MKEIYTKVKYEDEHDELEAMRKEYGHEVIVMYLLLCCGCTITFKRILPDTTTTEYLETPKRLRRYFKPKIK